MLDKKGKKAALALLTTGAAVAALATPASGAEMLRSGIALDATQCYCVYNTYHTASYIDSMPSTMATSYYDTRIVSRAQLYTRPTDINLYRAFQDIDREATQIFTVADQGARVLCWTDVTNTNEHVQMDKIGLNITVNGVGGLHWFYIQDIAIRDGVRYSDHHC